MNCTVGEHWALVMQRTKHPYFRLFHPHTDKSHETHFRLEKTSLSHYALGGLKRLKKAFLVNENDSIRFSIFRQKEVFLSYYSIHLKSVFLIPFCILFILLQISIFNQISLIWRYYSKSLIFLISLLRPYILGLVSYRRLDDVFRTSLPVLQEYNDPPHKTWSSSPMVRQSTDLGSNGHSGPGMGSLHRQGLLWYLA